MMPYSNENDAIPICRTRGACVNTPNFDASVVASCAFTPLEDLNYSGSASITT